MGQLDETSSNLTEEDIAEIEQDLFEVQPCEPEEIRTLEEDDGRDTYSLSEYDYTVWIDDGVEEILGDERFDNLIEAFSNIEGVVEVVQEDRDVFYFKAPDLSTAQLEEELKRVYFEMKRLN